MKVLVTGASGFLGQHLCAALCDEFEVTGTFGSSATFAEDFPKVAARGPRLLKSAIPTLCGSGVQPSHAVARVAHDMRVEIRQRGTLRDPVWRTA